MKNVANAIIQLQEVTFRYPDGSLGLDRCSLLVERGSRTAVLGANGAGKTTMFLHLNGILRPQEGAVRYQGDPLDYGRNGLHALRSRVGVVFQNPDSQLFSASVREDVSFGPLNLGLEKQVVRERVRESLLAVGLLEQADKPVQNLSFGQKKRVCIAGVLAMRPEVLILDEPMAGLDVRMQDELDRVLERLHGEGMTIIVATHDVDFAYRWADSIAIMASGSCAAVWETGKISGALREFAGHGLGVPRVAELHHHLVAAKMADEAAPAPRSHEELVRIVKDAHTRLPE